MLYVVKLKIILKEGSFYEKKSLKNIAMISILSVGVAVGAQANQVLANNYANVDYTVYNLGNINNEARHTQVRTKTDTTSSWASIATYIPNYIDVYDTDVQGNRLLDKETGADVTRKVKFSTVTLKEQYIPNYAFENNYTSVTMSFYAPYILGGIVATSGEWSPDSI